MKNGTRIFLIILIIVLMLAVAGSYTYCMVKAYAEGMEDLSSDTIVNFNQLFNNTISRGNYNSITLSKKSATYTVSGSFSNYTLRLAFNETAPSIPVFNGHKYYLDYNLKVNSGNEPTLQVFSAQNQVLDATNSAHIFTAPYDATVSLGFFVNNTYTYNFSVTPILVDLTQMFGSEIANTITLEQCENYFTAEYYPYNTGMAIPFSSDFMKGYISGVNDTLASFRYILNNSTVQTSMQNVDLENYYGEVTAYSDYVRIDGVSGRLTAAYLPFISPIPQGAHFKVSGRFTHNNGNGTLPVYISYLSNNEIISLASVRVTGGYANSYSFEFDSPDNLSGLYFVLDDDSGVDLTVYSATIEVLDVDYAAILYSAAENAKSQVEKNYLPNNPGYEAIYRVGYTKGQTDGNAALTSMDYIESAFVTLGEILAIEIFPNVPIGTFFMLPLMTGLIFFIVKLSKGGS